MCLPGVQLTVYGITPRRRGDGLHQGSPRHRFLRAGQPRRVVSERKAAGADDADVNKITWQNSCRFFSWDPFTLTPKGEGTVGALRAKGADVDVSIRPRAEWARLYDEKRFART